MKRLFFALAVVATICFGASSTAFASNGMPDMKKAQDNHPKINEFVAQHFPEATVLSVYRDGSEWEVMLSDFTKLEFTKKYDWKKVDCKHSTVYTEVPAALVPEQIASFVNAKFQDLGIVKIDKDRRNWEIELVNKVDLKFDLEFNLIEID